MKTLKFICLIFVLFLLSNVSQSQTIQLTISDDNYVSGDVYTLYFAIYDYSKTPNLQYYSPSPSQYFYSPNTYSDVPVPWQVDQDVEATVFEIKIRVYKNGAIYRDDTSGLLNSDGYYAGNIPLSVYF